MFLLEFLLVCLVAKERAGFQASVDTRSEGREMSALLVHVAVVDGPKHSFRTQVPHVVN